VIDEQNFAMREIDQRDVTYEMTFGDIGLANPEQRRAGGDPIEDLGLVAGFDRIESRNCADQVG